MRPNDGSNSPLAPATDETEAEALIARSRDIAAVHAAVILARWLRQQPGREGRAWELYRWAAEQGEA